MLYGFESKRDHDLSPHSCEKWTKESMKGMPPRVGGRCLRCARGSRLAGSLLARDVVGASSACTNEFHETRGGHTHTATEAQATAHYRPQRTAHRREASGEGFTIRRASRVGGTPPPNSNACACSLCAWCASCRAAQKSRMGAFSQLRWVSTEVGFKVRRTSRDWVGRELRAPLTPPATSHPIGHVRLAHGFGQHPL
jgi:hypothetical protein